ncbi:PREDICTED: uncharacterized protein LOC104812719 [Tarenaya hassleriana]|uniref:uncharacterized protein LOC104812719 n=1 Tax=Tarenaya hassleriana TaxID=28532 RepID=UPI00053C7AB1|nr:PREDICTED: uncharacterized protein LOC104812719 [Tarenaya hassleriana]
MQRTPNFISSALSLPSTMEDSEEEAPWKIFFSCTIPLYCLILLYFPQDFLRFLLSPVLLITGALLVSLLRLGSTRDSDSRPGKSSGNRGNPGVERTEESGVSTREPEWSSCKAESDMGFDQNPDFVDNFVEWNVRAPLEVIHEAYSEEDEDEEDDRSVVGEKDPTRLGRMERFPSLSLCYPESDSDSSSESDFPAMCGWVTPENVRYRWEEDEGEGLIEIRLDEQHNKGKQVEYDFHAEEESLIEIDLSP